MADDTSTAIPTPGQKDTGGMAAPIGLLVPRPRSTCMHLMW
ncbi:hypothetical protein H845_2709 [Komagataeibacter xylinus E25]|nr:hypothetical protein H845_2709 [Komagataeibacter xylinus E25]